MNSNDKIWEDFISQSSMKKKMNNRLKLIEVIKTLSSAEHEDILNYLQSHSLYTQAMVLSTPSAFLNDMSKNFVTVVKSSSKSVFFLLQSPNIIEFTFRDFVNNDLYTLMVKKPCSDCQLKTGSLDLNFSWANFLEVMWAYDYAHFSVLPLHELTLSASIHNSSFSL